MRRDLLDVLACPLCKGVLTLVVAFEDEGEIVTGTLACAECDAAYSIEDGIPDLLPPGVDGA